MTTGYTTEINVQILISLLKQHGIKRIIASPGSANMAFVTSVQHDPEFEIYSSVDERSAAYIACGLAEITGEAVVMTCTGATASRNYLPGMTEAYYKKLPVLAITSTQVVSKVGHLIAQVIDRSTIQHDVARISVSLPVVKSEDEKWECIIKVNNAILELSRHGGGPAHINLPTTYDHNYSVKVLPNYRKISRYTTDSVMPELPNGRIAIFVGSKSNWSNRQVSAIDEFCKSHNAVVICDHTSGYNGNFRANFAVLGCQNALNAGLYKVSLLIHLGEVSGDYYSINIKNPEVWRVSIDGEIRDTFRKLTSIFQMNIESFFEYYADKNNSKNDFSEYCNHSIVETRNKISNLPLSNIWVASRLCQVIPPNSYIHFGILNSLRAWNFFDLPKGVTSASNVGGFGIDGALSTTLGASLSNRYKLYFCVLGDLAFFYDMNALGNRHLSSRMRILLINNGKGTEFRQYGHISASLGDELDDFVAAAGHYGNKSTKLVKHYVEDLGFLYLSAKTKNEFDNNYNTFISDNPNNKPIVFEVFTNSSDEAIALETIMNLNNNTISSLTNFSKNAAKKILEQSPLRTLRRLINS